MPLRGLPAVRIGGFKAPQKRALPKYWNVGNKGRGKAKSYGGEKVGFLCTSKPAGAPGKCTAEYMNRPDDRDPDTRTWIIENGDIECWERGARTFAFVAPERTHDLLQVGRDIAADLHRRLGDDDAPVHIVSHRHQGREHLHIAVDGIVPAFKIERAVDRALEMRQERDRERVRDQELDKAVDRLFGRAHGPAREGGPELQPERDQGDLGRDR